MSPVPAILSRPQCVKWPPYKDDDGDVDDVVMLVMTTVM